MVLSSLFLVKGSILCLFNLIVLFSYRSTSCVFLGRGPELCLGLSLIVPEYKVGSVLSPSYRTILTGGCVKLGIDSFNVW